MTQHGTYRYYDFVMVAFVTVLVCSNLIGPAKISQMDLPLVGIVIGESGAGRLHDRTFGADDLLQHLSLLRL